MFLLRNWENYCRNRECFAGKHNLATVRLSAAARCSGHMARPRSRRFAGDEESGQAAFMLFMTMPTIAETIAPDTPPPTS